MTEEVGIYPQFVPRYGLRALSTQAQEKREDRSTKKHKKRESSIAVPSDFFQAEEVEESDEEEEDPAMTEDAKAKRQARATHRKAESVATPNLFGGADDDDEEEMQGKKRRGSTNLENDPRYSAEALAKREQRQKKHRKNKSSVALPYGFFNDDDDSDNDVSPLLLHCTLRWVYVNLALPTTPRKRRERRKGSIKGNYLCPRLWATKAICRTTIHKRPPPWVMENVDKLAIPLSPSSFALPITTAVYARSGRKNAETGRTGQAGASLPSPFRVSLLVWPAFFEAETLFAWSFENPSQSNSSPGAPTSLPSIQGSIE